MNSCNKANELNWRDKNFLYPNYLIRLVTCFSGVQAIKQAFKKLKIRYKIVFATDVYKKVKESYFENYNIDENKWYHDIYLFSAKKYKNQLDLLITGAFFKAFCAIGKKLVLEVKGKIFYKYARISSHIKPWFLSNSEEKIDCKNGFILSPLFDKDFIIFDSDKKILFLNCLISKNIKRVGINDKI